MTNLALPTQINILQSQLHSLGYSGCRGSVVSHYPFATPKGIATATLLAFADPHIRDISTSCVAVQEWPNGGDKQATLLMLSYVGVPSALFALPDQVEFWSISRPGSEPFLFHTSSYESDVLTEYFSRSGRQLSPESLLKAKKGTRQLSLFELDRSLEIFARDMTQKALVSRFEQAYSKITLRRSKLRTHSIDRLTIDVLAACILQDKLVDLIEYDDLQTNDIKSLLTAARKHFPNYFTKTDQALYVIDDWSILEILYQSLRSDFSFRSLTNEMLAYFYENTLVKAKESLRRELGIYYTPRYLTERILKRLPIEDLRPEQRTVLDGTCGSGNMLLAAYDRLSGLLPASLSLAERHDYLIEHIWGLDKDDFACEVARLSLLLYNLPAGNSWNVKQADVLQSDPQSQFGKAPHIIVGNPPFSGASQKGQQIEKAAKVLEKYLDWLAPNGLLGVVVPVSFLHNTIGNTPLVRKRLLEQCDILEVWQLPEGVFANSAVATAIILARKLPKSRTTVGGLLTRIDTVASYDLKKLKLQGGISNSHLANQDKWFSSPQHQMYSSHLDYLWERLEEQFLVADPNFCIIRNGVQPGKLGNRTHFSDDYLGVEWKPVLRYNKTGRALEPYAIDWEKQAYVKRDGTSDPSKYIKYPSDELHRQRNPEHFAQPQKLIMNGTRNASGLWRFFVAIDREKLVVTEYFHYILPSEKMSACELAAIFNSMLANCWYASHHYQKDVKQKILKQLPMATFSYDQQVEIRELVQAIAKAKQSHNRDKHNIRRNISRLDEIVFDAYGLSQREREQIKVWMGQYRRPGTEWEDVELTREVQTSLSMPKKWRPELAEGWQEERQWRFSGEVESVNPDSRRVSLWVQGQNDIVEVPIPDTMPGWALRSGSAFLASIPWCERYALDLTKVTWIDFEPLDYGYLSDDELTALMTGSEGTLA